MHGGTPRLDARGSRVETSDFVILWRRAEGGTLTASEDRPIPAHSSEDDLRRTARFRATAELIARAFLTGRDDERIFSRVLQPALDLLDSPAGAIGFLATPSQLTLSSVAGLNRLPRPGMSDDARAMLPVAAISDSPWGTALHTHLSVMADKPGTLPSLADCILCSVTSPIVFHDRPLGIVTVCNRPTGYTRSDAELLRRVTDYIAPILDAWLERRASDLVRRDREAQLQASQRVARIGHYLFDVRSGTWTNSPALDDIFGIDATFTRDVDGWLAIVHKDDGETMRTHLLEHVLTGHNPFDHEYRIIRRSDKAERWVHGLGQLEIAPDGSVWEMFGTIQDITERKLVEMERERLREQLQQAQKMESVGRLAGGVAHDFNNMLLAILGNASMALEHAPEGTPVRDHLDEIHKAAERSADLVQQLLAFARKQTVSPKVIDLDQMITGLMRMLGRLIGENIQLEWRPNAAPWRVCIDPAQVSQLLMNLAVNARDAIDGPGSVTIETARVSLDDTYAKAHPECVPGQYIMLAVSDTGGGMTPEVVAHLFEPFYTTKERGRGTGLGLSTVFGIVKQNGGSINVYTEPGHGSTFKIYLRRANGQFVGEQAPPETEVLGGTETVLLVEDEEQLLTLGRKMLEANGYTVLAARRPEDAATLADVHPGQIDLLVTDVVMPGMNGRELKERIEPLQPAMKTIFMSGYTANVIAHHGILDESVVFLQKPFTLRALVGLVRRVLDE